MRRELMLLALLLAGAALVSGSPLIYGGASPMTHKHRELLQYTGSGSAYGNSGGCGYGYSYSCYQGRRKLRLDRSLLFEGARLVAENSKTFWVNPFQSNTKK